MCGGSVGLSAGFGRMFRNNKRFRSSEMGEMDGIGHRHGPPAQCSLLTLWSHHTSHTRLGFLPQAPAVSLPLHNNYSTTPLHPPPVRPNSHYHISYLLCRRIRASLHSYGTVSASLFSLYRSLSITRQKGALSWGLAIKRPGE